MAGRRRLAAVSAASSSSSAATSKPDSKTDTFSLRSPLIAPAGGGSSSSSSSSSSSMAALEEGHAAAASGAASPKAAAPVDRYHLAYIIFYLQGVGQLFPWNAFITAGPYFSQRFCGTAHADDFENYFSLTFMLTNLVGQALCVRYARELARACGSVTARITGALACLLLVFLATTLVVLFKGVPRDPLFGFTNLGVALAGACTSLLQAAIFGYAAVFPPSYTQAMMAGQGLAGVIVAVAGIATAASSHVNPCDTLAEQQEAAAAAAAAAAAKGHKAEGDPDPGAAAICVGYDRVDYHAFGFFAACVAVLLLCTLSFLALESMPLARYYTRKLTRPPEASFHPHAAAVTAAAASSSSSSGNDGEGAALVDVVRSDEGDGLEEEEEGEEQLKGILAKQGSGSLLLEDAEAEAHAVAAHTPTNAGSSHHHHHHHHPPALTMARSGSSTSRSHHDDGGATAGGGDGINDLAHHDLPFRHMLRLLGSPGAAVFLVFAVTLAVFPSLTVHVVSAARCEGKGAFFDQGFVPFQFLLFNLCDFLGRTLAGAGAIVRPSRLWLWSLARAAFIPLFLLCTVEGSALPTLFRSDWWPTLFMLAFGTSNGYLSSLAMMAGPAQLGPHASPALAEAAGVTMVLLMTIGLSAGSGLSFLVTAASKGGF